MDYDFSGWATRNDLLCGDGRTIRKNSFIENDGETVPLIYNHDHSNPDAVLGHALLQNRDEGVYAYCKFNDTESGQHAKKLVNNGDVRSLSIYANKLKQIGHDVIHGSIKELSLVLAGANPGAYIDFVMAHGDDEEDGLYANYDESALVLYHSDSSAKKEEKEMQEEKKAPESNDTGSKKKAPESNDKGRKKTVQDVLDTFDEEQIKVLYALVGQALQDAGVKPEDLKEDEEGDEEEMKHNVFDNDMQASQNVLTHSDQEAIIALAKSKNVGSFQSALELYAEDHLAHGIDSIESLFPEYELTNPGAPEMLTRDQTWVDSVLSKAHKSPISRIRTRHADVRAEDIRAMGYKKTKEKKLIANLKLLNRTTDPQTVYVKDKLERDDIIDITDFDVVEYQRKIMRMALNEEIAKAILIGDGREEGDEGKIQESHIRSIWKDDDLYTIRADVDVAAAKKELQGSNTSANFGDNYVYAEAIITAALYAREKYKGSGSLDFYCTPHLLNVMLLARDLNGRRIYDSKSDLAAALNVSDIKTVEQFEGKTRTTTDGNTKKLLGLFVNMSDYQIGSTKGGEITNFEDFDIDFNNYKYLMETRLSGALTKAFSAIALEEPVAKPSQDDTDPVAG